jgi:Fur family zinc uptake transcriptional regulator
MVYSFESHCLKVLKASGAKLTSPRRSVIRVLSQSRQALTARDVLEKIDKTKDLENVDPVSVYRVLDLLAQLDLIHQVKPEGRYVICRHLHCGTSLHILTRCQDCGQTEELDLPPPVIQPLLQFLQKESLFETRQHHFQIDGCCQTCRR